MRNLCPPLYEAPVADWIRRHALVECGVERVTYEEMQEGARRSRCPDFAREIDARFGWVTVDEFERWLDFYHLRHNRLVLGHRRYQVTGRGPYDRIGRALEELEAFGRDLNLERLVDAANLIELEWITPSFEGTWWDDSDHRPDHPAWSTLLTYRCAGNRFRLVEAYLAVGRLFLSPPPGAHFTAVDDGVHTKELP